MVKTQKAVTDLGQFGYALTGYFYFSMATTKQLACLKHKQRSHLSVTTVSRIFMYSSKCSQYIPFNIYQIFLKHLVNKQAFTKLRKYKNYNQKIVYSNLSYVKLTEHILSWEC